jgi:3-oxoacyl-[acyl-carrier protein] reductase
MGGLYGKVALVPGASRGIGAKIALFLAEPDADLVINYWSQEPRAAGVAASIQAIGVRVILAQADLTNPQDLARRA